MKKKEIETIIKYAVAKSRYLSIYALAFVGIMIMAIGGALNEFVVSKNAGKMPVFDYSGETPYNYFSFNNFKDANYSLLGDIHTISTPNNTLYYSIGDAVATVGIIFLITSAIKGIFLFRKNNFNEKDAERLIERYLHERDK